MLLQRRNKVRFFSDLHEEACQESSLDVDGVGSGTEGGHRDGQLDPLQGVCELGAESVSHQKSAVVQVEVPAPLLHVAV